MDGGEVVNMAFSDLSKGNGPHQGYLILCQAADTVFCRWQGEVTTTLTAEEKPVTTFQGAWYYIKGAGQYQNVQGRGTYNGKYVSQTEYVVDWEGEYFLKE
jgi:hypothetical protein